jgi:LacI family transcriptional regulator
MLTIRDVAKYCNVSTATVSKAFNQDSDISYETVERVRAAARYLGYYPNAAARSLKTRHAYNLGLLAQLQHRKGIYTDFVTGVISAFQAGAERNGYDVTFVSKNISGRTMSYEEHYLYRDFEGVAMICVDFFSPQVRALLEKEIPCVTIDYPSDRHASVMTDNRLAYDQMIDYAYRKGHRNIAVIRDSETMIADIRYDCICKACAERGLIIPDGHTFFSLYNDIERAKEATRNVLRLPQLPTLIIYPDDISCVGGIDELKAHGLSVPQDISVMGFDGIQLSQMIRPRLTTYRQDTEAIGNQAVHTLLEIVGNRDVTLPIRQLVPGEFLPGETVGAL